MGKFMLKRLIDCYSFLRLAWVGQLATRVANLRISSALSILPSKVLSSLK